MRYDEKSFIKGYLRNSEVLTIELKIELPIRRKKLRNPY